jgi:putative tryptophan/tyrosine transport system substrate-binding protein
MRRCVGSGAHATSPAKTAAERSCCYLHAGVDDYGRGGAGKNKIARVGYLGQAPAASFAPRVEALRAGLLDLGYIQGSNLALVFRWADDPAQLPQLAGELIRAGSEVIFAPSSTETAAALAATKTVPVVFGAPADPVGVKHVRSLAEPGGNATGMTMLLTDLVAKELEVLREALPTAKRSSRTAIANSAVSVGAAS